MPKTQEPPPRRTPNQVVARNLREARLLRGLTQEEAAAKLEGFLGVRWSKATFSAAERSFSSDRSREFTADEVFAMAQAFDLPISWFFVPPGPGTHVFSALPDGEEPEELVRAQVLLEMVFPAATDELVAEVARRFGGYPGPYVVDDVDCWRALHDHVVALVDTFAHHETGGLSNRRDRLRTAMVAIEAVGDLFNQKGTES